MTRLTIGGETFRVEVEGDPSRPALLLSNSLGTNLHLWDAQMPVLREHFRVIRYDSRGHGNSVTSNAPISIGDLGRDALHILDALEVERAHFVGISMGGAVGQWLLTHAPERLERAVLACTAAKFGTPETWNQRIVTIRSAGMAGPADATLERWFSGAFASRNADQVAPIRKMLHETSLDGYVSCCAALRDMDLRQSLVGVDVPTLLITGTDDPVIAPADTNVLKTALADPTHISLDARHIANIEAATAFTDAVVKFLTARRTPKRRSAFVTTAKPTPRGKATTRATTARRPLGKVATRPKKARVSAAAARKTAVSKARKAAAPRKKRPTVRATPIRALPAKATTTKKSAAPKKSSARKKATAKAMPARRPTKATAARGAVKKSAGKTKPNKAAKKRTKPATAKRLPTARRKSTKSPRRPTGHRKR